MCDLPKDLLSAVQDQAEARVRMDFRGYAKYLTPAAIESLRASFQGLPPRVSRYEIDSHDMAGEEYVLHVRYFVRDDFFVIRSRWRREEGEWRVTHAERIWAEDEKRPGLLSRLVGSVVGFLSALRRQ